MPTRRIHIDNLRAAFALVADRWPRVVIAGSREYLANGSVQMPDLAARHNQISDSLQDDFWNEDQFDAISAVDWSLYIAVANCARIINSIDISEIDWEAILWVLLNKQGWRIDGEYLIQN